MPTASLRSATIEYRSVGEAGDPTVLVHGSWTDSEAWRGVVTPLSQGLAVIAYDRRGYGGSRGPAPTHSVREDAEDLAQLLESTDQFPAHLVAVGFGTAVALRLGIDRPELVRSVMAHDPPFLGLLHENPLSRQEGAQLIAEVHRDQARVRAGEGERIAQERWDREAGEPGAWGRIDASLRHRWALSAERWACEREDPETLVPDRAELAGLDLPVLLTTGERSLPCYGRIAELLLESLRNAQTHTILGVGHHPEISSPETFVGLVASFLLERNVPST
jgi:pimeloyl-ACP methyl ester carboxylesterase